MKIKFLGLSICLGASLLSASSCNDSNFFKFDNDDISYQIYAGKNDIVRIVRRNDGLPYSLQLFDQRGNLLRDATISTPFTFEFTKCQNDSVTISYLVGKSNLAMFLPWLKANKFNPTEFGTYKIAYSYTINKGTFNNTTKTIDSIFVAKNVGKARLYLRNRLVDEVPIEFFYVYQDSFSYFKNRTLIRCELTDTVLVGRYLDDIVTQYK